MHATRVGFVGVVVSALLAASGCEGPRPNWIIGLPFCGDGNKSSGEACDPPGQQAQCAAGEICTGTCMCAPACDCCAANPKILELTTRLDTQSCGAATDIWGMVFRDLTRGGMYFGGGGNAVPLPGIVVDGVSLPFAVNSCDAATQALTLGPTPAPSTGLPEGCTSSGCLIGPPMPITGDPPAWSQCIVNRFALDASGTATCDGTVNATVPLTQEVFWTGDVAPSLPGVQPCPVCVLNHCVGGANNGGFCRPQGSLQDAAHPTSNDCPPAAASSIGVAVAVARLTSAQVAAKPYKSGFQYRVFCGYCRDVLGSGKFQSPVTPCVSDADCKAPYDGCEQRDGGAFGPNGGAVEHIGLSGAPAECLADSQPHPAMLVGGACVQPPPPSAATMAALYNLPGPEVLSLPCDLQLK